MSDREIIKAEIERRILDWRMGMSAEAKYRLEAYTELLEVFNTLPKEPASEKTKVIPTKINNVFNGGDKFSFDVNTPQFLKEACEDVKGGMYAVCWNIFKNLLTQVVERAAELNDPVLNTLMIRLNLYEIPNEERYKIINQLKEMYDKSVKQ